MQFSTSPRDLQGSVWFVLGHSVVGSAYIRRLTPRTPAAVPLQDAWAAAPIIQVRVPHAAPHVKLSGHPGTHFVSLSPVPAAGRVGGSSAQQRGMAHCPLCPNTLRLISVSDLRPGLCSTRWSLLCVGCTAGVPALCSAAPEGPLHVNPRQCAWALSGSHRNRSGHELWRCVHGQPPLL